MKATIARHTKFPVAFFWRGASMEAAMVFSMNGGCRVMQNKSGSARSLTEPALVEKRRRVLDGGVSVST